MPSMHELRFLYHIHGYELCALSHAGIEGGQWESS